MTGILNLTGRLLKGALVGGLVGLGGSFGLITVMGLIFYGPSGLLMGFYFGALPIFYVAPIGMLVGVVVAIFNLVRKPAARIGITTKVWVGLLIIGFVVLAYLPHRVIGEVRMITHGARWTIEGEASENCLVPKITLYLVEYAHYEEVCSALSYIALSSERRDIIPITYTVTYDFGDVRGYSLKSVGTIDVFSSGWLGGGDECGREPFPTCDSPQAKNERMLYESSWVE